MEVDACVHFGGSARSEIWFRCHSTACGPRLPIVIDAEPLDQSASRRLSNRGTMALSVHVQCHSCVATATLWSVRLSLTSGLRDDSSEEVASLAETSRQLVNEGVHILDFSNGFYTVDRRLIYPGCRDGRAAISWGYQSCNRQSPMRCIDCGKCFRRSGLPDLGTTLSSLSVAH